MTDLVRRFLSRIYGDRSQRLALRVSPEERVGYDAAARIASDKDASAWARRVLNDKARELLTVKR